MNLVNVEKRRALSVVNAAADLACKAGNALARPAVVGLTGLVAAGSSHAAGVTIDTSDIVSTISGGVTAVSAIGVAVISLVVVIKLYKWVQRVL
ncbi:major capsid protein [Alicycliphilus denitrificans]|uniref:major capsid protein n=1 Tax=Alicycliphilus denitrificans TaxID=179636 RepID=UPI00384DBC05